VPGEELAKVFYDIVEMEQFAGRRVLVVGGGDSAVESAVGLANQAGTTVSLSYRSEAFARIKPRNQEKLDRVVAAGRVRLLLGTQVREVRPDVVVLEGKEGTALLPNDDVVIRIGGDAPYPFLERIGVRLVQKDIPIPGDQAKVS
jgi:thioredoxin reductase